MDENVLESLLLSFLASAAFVLLVNVQSVLDGGINQVCALIKSFLGSLNASPKVASSCPQVLVSYYYVESITPLHA
jgi:hypothetical protein